jgi:Nif-specific regulatory protein
VTLPPGRRTRLGWGARVVPGRTVISASTLVTLSVVLDVPAGQRLQRERDLYCKCLELARSDDPGPMLADALELLRDLAAAGCGYIEVEDIASNGARRWVASAGVDDAGRRRIEERISRGVIAEAVETGETVHTPSALLDERFRDRKSVREASIETVLCVPVRAEGVVGVVYLQNRTGGGPFLEDDVACVEVVARFVGWLAGHLLELLRHRQADDKTSAVRSRIRSDGIIGRSAVLAALLERIELIATMETNVLFTGPGGTGKSMLARILHDNSRRARGPFVVVNCAALPEGLIESELFGSERGAHSAVTKQGIEGKVSAAEKGTLFLDEIGELPLDVQAKVLHLVQSKEYYRLGGTRPIRADVRIVTATNRDLEQAMAERRFREDLYYRIRSVLLEVPPLADRRDDIPLLARHFCVQSCLSNGLPEMPLSSAAVSAVEFADWPGNIRQLASRCEEAVVNARLERSLGIELRHMFPGSGGDEPAASTSFHAARQQFERAFLDRALQVRDWNVAATAKDLELSRSHLNALIRRYGLCRDG